MATHKAIDGPKLPGCFLFSPGKGGVKCSETQEETMVNGATCRVLYIF